MSDRGGELPVGVPETKIEKRFAAFGQIQRDISEKLISSTPAAIVSQNADSAKILTLNISSNPLREAAEEGIQRYVSQEKGVSLWAVQQGFHTAELEMPYEERSEETQQRQAEIAHELVQVVSQGRTLEMTDQQLSKIRVQRTHGGFAIIAPLEIVQQLAGVSYESATGAVTDPQQVASEMAKYRDFGLAIGKKDLTGEGLPEGGMDIILVANTSENIPDVISHEEGELLGMHIEEGLLSLQENAKSLLGHGYDTEAAGILSDMASRVEHQGQEASLGASGLSRAYVQEHPREAAVLSLLHRKAAEMISTTGKENDVQRQQIADELRGAFLRPEQLLEVWYKGEDIGKLVEQEELRIGSEAFTKEVFGDADTPVFTSDRQGRFIYVRKSLVEHVPGTASELGKDKLILTDKNGNRMEILIMDDDIQEHEIDKDDPFDPVVGNVYKAVDIANPAHKFIVKEPYSLVAEALLNDPIGFVQRVQGLGLPQQETINRIRGALGVKQVEDIFVHAINTRLTLPNDRIAISTASDGSFQVDPKINNTDFYTAVTAAAEEVAQNKVIHDFYENAQQKVVREVEAHTLLDGVKGIAKAYGFASGSQDLLSPSYGDKTYFVQEFIEGKDLESIMTGAIMPYEDIRRDGEALLETLSEVHKRGVIHRDIKPANIIRATDGKLYLLDLGEAIVPGFPIPKEQTGSPGYAAPEVYEKGTTDMTPAVDAFAFGALLYEQATGKPFGFTPSHLTELKRQSIQDMRDKLIQGGDSDAVADAKINTFIHDTRHAHFVATRDKAIKELVKAKIPFELRDIIKKALEEDPAQRYRDAGEMLQAFTALPLQYGRPVRPGKQSPAPAPRPAAAAPTPPAPPAPTPPSPAPARPAPAPRPAPRPVPPRPAFAMPKVVDIQAGYNPANGPLVAYFDQLVAGVDAEKHKGIIGDPEKFRVYATYARALREALEKQPTITREQYGQWAELLGKLRVVAPTPMLQDRSKHVQVQAKEIEGEIGMFLDRLTGPTSTITTPLLQQVWPLIEGGVLRSGIPTVGQIEGRIITDVLTKADIIRTKWYQYVQAEIPRIDTYLGKVDTNTIQSFVANIAPKDSARAYVRYRATVAIGDRFDDTEKAFEDWAHMLKQATPTVLVRGGRQAEVTKPDLDREAVTLFSNLRALPDASFPAGMDIAVDLLHSDFYKGDMRIYRKRGVDAVFDVLEEKARNGVDLTPIEGHMTTREFASNYFQLQKQLAAADPQKAITAIARVGSGSQGRVADVVPYFAAKAIREIVSLRKAVTIPILRQWADILRRLPLTNQVPAGAREFEVGAITQEIAKYVATHDKDVDVLLRDVVGMFPTQEDRENAFRAVVSNIPSDSPQRIPFLATRVMQTQGGEGVAALVRQLGVAMQDKNYDYHQEVNRVRRSLVGNPQALRDFEAAVSRKGIVLSRSY